MPRRGISARTLPGSRNRLFSTQANAWRGTAIPATPPPEYILACIDIAEPLHGNPGDIKNIPFRYRAGYPTSIALYIEWFFTEEDAKNLRNPLDKEHYLLPKTTPTPSIPEPDTGDWQWGSVLLEIPKEWRTRTSYGAMIIEQPAFSGPFIDPGCEDIL